MRNYPPEDELRIDGERKAFIDSRCGKQFVCKKPNEVNSCNQLPNDKCDDQEPDNQPLVTLCNQLSDKITPSNQLSNEATPTNQLPDQITPSNQLPDKITSSNQLFNEATPTNQLPDQITSSNQLSNEATPINQLPYQITPSNELFNEATPTNQLPDQITPSNELFNEATPINQLPKELLPNEEVLQSKKVKFKTDDTPLPKPWAEHFKPRSATEVVKNCSQVDRSVQLDIVTMVTRALLERPPRWIELSQNKPEETEVQLWNRGGTYKM